MGRAAQAEAVQNGSDLATVDPDFCVKGEEQHFLLILAFCRFSGFGKIK